MPPSRATRLSPNPVHAASNPKRSCRQRRFAYAEPGVALAMAGHGGERAEVDVGRDKRVGPLGEELTERGGVVEEHAPARLAPSADLQATNADLLAPSRSRRFGSSFSWLPASSRHRVARRSVPVCCSGSLASVLVLIFLCSGLDPVLVWTCRHPPSFPVCRCTSYGPSLTRQPPMLDVGRAGSGTAPCPNAARQAGNERAGYGPRIRSPNP